MKTERRHELQTNVLATSLAHWIERVKPYSRALLAGVVAIVVALFAWVYLSNQSSTRLANGWTEYFEVMNRPERDPREGLADIADRYAGTPVGQWARLVAADIQLQEGTNHLTVDKGVAQSELRKAAEGYQAVLIDGGHEMQLDHATFGLARAHEALGTLAKAREEYRSIARQWPDSPFVIPAEQRAKDLDERETKTFYDWLAKYEPPRATTGLPGARPDFIKDTLDEGGFKAPSLEEGSLLPKLSPQTSEPAEDAKPAEGDDAKPPADAPADQPAPDKPAEPAPADDKAADAPAPSDAPAPADAPPESK